MRICRDLFQFRKSTTSSNSLNQFFITHSTQHTNSFRIFTDGSKSGEGVGYAFTCPSTSQARRIHPIASSYIVELLAIKDAMDYAIANGSIQSVTIHSDSRSAIEAISNPFIKYPAIQHIQALINQSNKTFKICCVPSHIGVPGNEEADTLARNCISTQLIFPLSLPRSDIKCFLKHRVGEAWHHTWTQLEGNKLREILPCIAPKFLEKNPRSWATKLARLQIGHTPLTHSFLITRDPLPYCDDCLVPLTIKHLLTECPSHNHHWLLFGCPGPPTMPNIFRPANCFFGGPLQAFIRNVGFLQSIWSTNPPTTSHNKDHCAEHLSVVAVVKHAK